MSEFLNRDLTLKELETSLTEFDIPSDCEVSDCDDIPQEDLDEIDNLFSNDILQPDQCDQHPGNNLNNCKLEELVVSEQENNTNGNSILDIVSEQENNTNENLSKMPTAAKKSYRNVVRKVGNQTFSDVVFGGVTDIPLHIKELETPFQFFNYFINNDVYNLITVESHKYSLHKDINKPFHISVDEVKRYFGVLLIMSVVKLNNIRSYWDPIIGNRLVIETMSLNEFEKIRRYMHFSDLENMPDKTDPQYDKLYRIRPIITHLNKKFSSVPFEEHVAVDEQICATKAKHHMKTYNPMKPHKWGFKNFVLCGASGYAYQFEFYSGSVTDQSEPDLGPSANVVKRLAATLPVQKEKDKPKYNYKLYCDNYYTSIGLLVHLQSQDIYCVGTIRRNRFPNLKLPSEKEFKNLGRGSSSENFCTIDGSDISVVSWYDNKVVTLSSTYIGENPKDFAKRYDRKEKKRIEIERPAIVREYNKFMGGVDLMDMLIGLHKIGMRTKKLYFRMFYHLLDMSVVNAWLLFRRTTTNNAVTLTKFRVDVAYTLCKSGNIVQRVKRGRPSNENLQPSISKKKRGPQHPVPTIDVRKDGVGHIPAFIDNRIRCKHPECKKQTFVVCEKCNVGLCFSKTSNCFKTYHTN